MPTAALHFTPRDIALHAARCCQDKGGEDVRVLELTDGALFDFVVIATGRSDRQTGAIADDVFRFCKRWKVAHHPVEGAPGWHLIDCIDVVVHAMDRDCRERYQIDRLWPQARDLDLARELAALPPLAET